MASVKRIVMAAVLSVLLGSTLVAAKKPLKVYILAGQSNMQGSAHKNTFAAIGDDPMTANLLSDILDKKGDPVVCNKAWITYLTQVSDGDTTLHGKVGVGYGFDSERIGPEYAFGLYMDKALDEPILIIKTAWGGKSLAVDFRPPSSGPYEPSLQEIERGNVPDKEKVGHYYRKMIRYIQTTLKDAKSIRKIVPNYHAKQGYELSGFIWFQGWNDMCNRHHIEQYTENMIHFIRDVRKELDVPTLPFIIGILGVYGTNPDSRKFDKTLPVSEFRKTQFAAVEQYDQKVDEKYRGNVVGVDSGPFYELELSDIYWKRRLTSEWEWRVKEGKMTPEEAKKEREHYGFPEGGLTAEEQRIWDRCASNAEYHYLGSGKTFIRLGKALAEAMFKMEKNCQVLYANPCKPVKPDGIQQIQIRIGFLNGGCDYHNHQDWRDGMQPKDQEGYSTEIITDRQVFFGYEPKLGTAMRDGNWKMLTKGDGVELYDLSQDIKETSNIAEKFPERTEKMKAAIQKWKINIKCENE